MKTLIIKILIINVVVFFSLNIVAKTVVVNKNVKNNEIIKSVSSGLCHIPTNAARSSLKILDDRSNVYNSILECVENGGVLTEENKKEVYLREPSVVEEIEKREKERQKKAANDLKSANADKQFFGINWGLGLAYTVLNKEIVKDISIENNTIRVNHQINNRAIAMLESHYLIETDDRSWGHGPFMAVGLVGEDGIDPLSTYGIGYMFGIKKDEQGNSWNIGAGFFMDTEVSQLRKGLSNGDATSETDPNKLLTKIDASGWMLIFSANF